MHVFSSIVETYESAVIIVLIILRFLLVVRPIGRRFARNFLLSAFNNNGRILNLNLTTREEECFSCALGYGKFECILCVYV